MKTTACILILLFTYSVSKAQVAGLTGTWTMFELTTISNLNSITGPKTQKTTEKMVKANIGVIGISFLGNGIFKQTVIKPGENTQKVFSEGTWKTKGNELFFTFIDHGKNVDFVLTYELRGDKLYLSMISLDGKMISNSYFRRE